MWQHFDTTYREHPVDGGPGLPFTPPIALTYPLPLRPLSSWHMKAPARPAPDTAARGQRQTERRPHHVGGPRPCCSCDHRGVLLPSLHVLGILTFSCRMGKGRRAGPMLGACQLTHYGGQSSHTGRPILSSLPRSPERSRSSPKSHRTGTGLEFPRAPWPQHAAHPSDTHGCGNFMISLQQSQRGLESG